MPDPKPADKTPDALMIPTSWAASLPEDDTTNLLCTYAEKVLGGDRANGVTAHVTNCPGGMLFVRLNPNDKLCHDYGHPRQGRPRYVWTDMPDGSKRGVLTPDATPAPPLTKEIAPTPTNPIAKMAADERAAKEKLKNAPPA